MSVSKSMLELRTREVGPWPVNTYALVCPHTRQSVLIDPGADPEALLDLLGDSEPVAILITHTHPDHIGALDEIRARLDVPVMAHPGPHFDGLTLDADRWLNHGDTLSVGQHTVRVYHIPGHISDLICFALRDESGEGDQRVIVGDAIFEGGPGKTWSVEGFRTTLRDLQDVILAWPDETMCYPGHGPAFRLGDKRAEIEAFLAKDHGDFFGDAIWDMGAQSTLLDFTSIRSKKLTMSQLVADLTPGDLRRLTNEMVDTMLRLTADCVDADVVLVPEDPAADDPYAADEAQVHMAWTLGHVIVHTTASAEESAALAAELARGVENHGRSRSEVPWEIVTTIAQCRQRLEESRRMRLASLDMWPDEPYLENTYESFGGQAINAVARFVWGLKHDDDHLGQIAEIVRQAQARRS